MPTNKEPNAHSIRRYLRYGLSIPERALRSTAGVVGGALRESAAVLLPQAFRDAKTYRVFVGQMLDFMAEDMGGVQGTAPSDEPRVEGYVARKTVGNFVELASLATLHLSPMLVLAVVSDVAYGSKAYLNELAEELEKRQVIDDAATIQKADDLLAAVADVSRRTATAFDTPPLSIDGTERDDSRDPGVACGDRCAQRLAGGGTAPPMGRHKALGSAARCQFVRHLRPDHVAFAGSHRQVGQWRAVQRASGRNVARPARIRPLPDCAG